MQTSIDQIVDYWSHIEDECVLSVDWAEAHELCWRCGYKSNLQRCHIIPDALGGTDEPSNLVLLCGRCHREAPNVADPQFMWLWLRAHATPHYSTYWTLRGVNEFEQIFGRKPFVQFENSCVTSETIQALLAEYMQKTIRHFGEGRLNPSTIAWVLMQIEQRLSELSDSRQLGKSA